MNFVVLNSGKSSFKVRSRVMVLLGEQLITDEIAALSELIKNAYDADCTELKIELNNVSDQKRAEIIITDNGHGMTKDKLLTAWLELGTLSKARKRNEKKYSEIFHRPYLGEKGLGRLAVHKIGKKTELITKRDNAVSESLLKLDWSQFEDQEKFLEDIGINWVERTPEIFNEKNNYKSGTRIAITNFHRNWTKDMIKEIKKFVATIKSPFSGMDNFTINLYVADELDEPFSAINMDEVFNTANYHFTANVNKDGYAKIKYSYKSKLYTQFNRKEEFPNKDLKQYSGDCFKNKKPICGEFKFVIYCWDLDPKDKKATFDESVTYDKMVKPLVGIKIFRDNFRVRPYGNLDNDWLNMDKRRVSRFQENVSRNQVLGVVEISTKNNPNLVDKSDREGLIDNDEFQDFRELVQCALKFFQNERDKERLKIKKIKREDVKIQKLSKQFAKLTKILDEENISPAVKDKIKENIFETKTIFEKILEESEEPLIAAASLGLTYMIPTHEAQRDIHEGYRLLGKLSEKADKSLQKEIKIVVKQLEMADEILQGIVKISQGTQNEERFKLSVPINFAIDIMKQKAKRNNIEISYDIKIKESIAGTERLFSILLLNIIDNSIYWLNTQSNAGKKIKVSYVNYDTKFNALIVSDNGPGFEDNLEYLTNPFVTRKTRGMGLGLYICDRISLMHKGKLMILDEFEFPGLLSGANLAFLIPKE